MESGLIAPIHLPKLQPMETFIIKFDTSEGLSRTVEIAAPSLDAAIQKFDLMHGPGDFIESIGKPICIQWPEDWQPNYHQLCIF